MDYAPTPYKRFKLIESDDEESAGDPLELRQLHIDVIAQRMERALMNIGIDIRRLKATLGRTPDGLSSVWTSIMELPRILVEHLTSMANGGIHCPLYGLDRRQGSS